MGAVGVGLIIGGSEAATGDAVDEVALNLMDREADPREVVVAASSRMEEVAEVVVNVGVAAVMIEDVDRGVAAEVHSLTHSCLTLVN